MNVKIRSHSRLLNKLIIWLTCPKLKMLSFEYYAGYKDSDLLWSTFKARYVRELREEVEKFIAELDKEYDGLGETNEHTI